MDQKTIATSETPEVVIEQVSGDLQVKGWERSEVNIRANPDDLTLEEQDDTLRLSCRGNCAIRLPSGATVRVESAHGDARFKLLEDELSIERVHGSLTLRNVAGVQIDTISGNLEAKNIAGDLQVHQVQGNAGVRNVEGICLLDQVSGNLDVRDVENEVKVSCDGNARVRLSVLAGNQYEINARGNVECRIPEDADLSLSLSSKANTIRVKLPHESKTLQDEEYSLTLGDGTAEMALSAGGMIYLSSQSEDQWDENAEGFGFPGEFNRHVGEQIEAQIEAQMEAMTRQIDEQMANLSSMIGKTGLSEEQTEQIFQRARETSERATARAQERMRRAQEKLERKLEAARRRNEMKAQAAERRTQTRGKRSWYFEWGSPPPRPASEGVSDEERLMILRMLEQKKITLEEAEELLSALEGKE